MTIAGIGTDLVEIARLERVLERHGDRLPRRILSEAEFAAWVRSGRSARYLAKRFATKEAGAKALGTGFAGGIRWRDVETVHDAQGKPALRFHGEALARCQALGVSRSELSVTDERQYALAFVILQR